MARLRMSLSAQNANALKDALRIFIKDCIVTVFEYGTAEEWSEAASFLFEEGLHAEAVKCLTRGLYLEPDNGYLWFNLALVYRKQNRMIDSIHALKMAAHFISDDANLWDTVGVSLFELGDFETSFRAFENAFQHDQTSSRIWNNYGALLFNQKKYREAKDAFETALLLDQENCDAFLNLADTYEELNQNEKRAICQEIIDKLEL